MQLLESFGGALDAQMAGFVQMFLINILGNIAPHKFENNRTIQPVYDFIVVGSGAAGSVVAARLSETNARVLLLEAGGDAPAESAVPGLNGPTLINPKLQWGFRAISRPGLSNGYNNNSIKFPQGKAMGGSTTINSMIYSRGNQKDYNNWAKLGNPGWDFQSLLPYFKKSEDFQGYLTPETDKYHGKNGKLTIEKKRHNSLFVRRAIQAFQEMGYNAIDDCMPHQIGIAPHHVLTKEGIRASASESFLRPVVRRKNLDILKNAYVTKIIFNKAKRAVGVKFHYKNKERVVRVRKEVIVSAGVINTPKILMLSGVGPARHLEQRQIPVVASVEGVGKNFQDHCGIYALPITINQGVGMSAGNPKNILKLFMTNRTGFLSAPTSIEANAFLSLSGEDKDWADIYMSFNSVSPSQDGGIFSRAVIDMKEEYFDAIYGPMKFKPAVAANVRLARPKSTGWVKLKSKNPLVNPLIDFNFISHPEEIKLLIKGINFFLNDFLQTDEMKLSGAKFESQPIPGYRHMKFLSDQYWECHIKSLISTSRHGCCTAKMAPKSDPLGVVDNRLRLRGVKGVRVIDTSIMPKVTTGNTVATAYVIGEKGSDIVKKDWGYAIQPLPA